MLGRAGMIAVVLFLGACGAEERQLVVVLHDEVDSDAVRFEVMVFRPAADTTCGGLLGDTNTLEFPDAVAQIEFERDAPLPLGHLGEDRFLMMVRAWSVDCRLAHACREFEVAKGVEEEVRVELTEFLSTDPTCPESYQCAETQCVYCDECCFDLECNDNLPETTDVCVAGSCSVESDHDEDGVPLPLDCNDRNGDVHPGATPDCGHALDFDCDGLIDDSEGCTSPSCWLGHVVETDRRTDLRAQAIVSFGAFVAAAIDDEGGTALWLGSLDGNTLLDVGAVHLEGTTGFRPHDLAIYGTSAFVSTGDSSQIYVVDISVPGQPVQIDSFALEASRATRSLAVAPPMLWIVRSEGFDVFDISQTGPGLDWPDLVIDRLDPGFAMIYQRLMVRDLNVYATGRTTGFYCAYLESAVDIPDNFEVCFNAVDHGLYPQAIFSNVHVTPERELFVASATGGTPPDDSPPLIWRFVLDDQGSPSLDGVRVAQVPAEPSHFLVAGGSIFRSTPEGLYIHSKANFDSIEVETSILFDVDANGAVYGPPVHETAVLGTSAVLAAGDEGIVVLSLSCR